MFSNDDLIEVAHDEVDLWDLIDNLLLKAAESALFDAAIMTSWKSDFDVEVLSTANYPIEPLQGRNKYVLTEVVRECSEHIQKAHVHKISVRTLKKINAPTKSIFFVRNVAFVPCRHEDEIYIVLGLWGEESDHELTRESIDLLLPVVVMAHKMSQNSQLINKLRTFEQYIKEVSHDFSSSIQSTVSKLTHIKNRRYHEELIPQKAAEAEAEIWSAYRYASNIGFVIDPDYKLSNCSNFNLIDIIRTVVKQNESEAEERHIVIDIFSHLTIIQVCGDENAIATALSHYIINAIKYSFGGGKIIIEASTDASFGIVSVKNKGISLKDHERIKIWECGERGEEALERHVNGSGIGLYTVKKIIKAHGGEVEARNVNKDSVRFSFRIPTQISSNHVIAS